MVSPQLTTGSEISTSYRVSHLCEILILLQSSPEDKRLDPGVTVHNNQQCWRVDSVVRMDSHGGGTFHIILH